MQRAFDLFDVSFSHYFPGNIDPDEQEVRERCRQEAGDNTLDDLLSPLLVLISRLCIADDGSKARVRQWLVPDDLDRSTALEARSDLLGRCLRLLGSVYHPRLKDAVGEMLFAMSDSNGSSILLLS
jgi:Guanine nucleotide exchange factor synembryn